MTEHTAPASTGTDDWWSRLYGPDEPEPAPEPGPAPAAAGRTVRVTGNSGRLPDWRTGQTIDLSDPDTDEDTGQGTQGSGTGLQDKGQDAETGQDSPGPDAETGQQDTVVEDARPARFRFRLRKQDTPVPDSEGQDTGTDTPATEDILVKAPASPKSHAYLDDKRLRVIAFNGTAASVGYALGLVPILGSVLPLAEQAVTGMAALVLATAGGYGAWRLTGLPYVHKILPYPPVSRAVITTITAEIGRRAAPSP